MNQPRGGAGELTPVEAALVREVLYDHLVRTEANGNGMPPERRTIIANLYDRLGNVLHSPG